MLIEPAIALMARSRRRRTTRSDGREDPIDGILCRPIARPQCAGAKSRRDRVPRSVTAASSSAGLMPDVPAPAADNAITTIAAAMARHRQARAAWSVSRSTS
jgi:hypothetical protein